MFETVTRVRAPQRHPFQHIAILNDYVRVPYATGSTFAAQLLHQEFRRRGHDVTLVGPKDPNARPEELPERHVLLPSIPLRAQPGCFLPIPTRRSLRRLVDAQFDVMVGQSGSDLVDAGVWLRATQNVPLLCVNTTLLNRLYDTLLPESWANHEAVHRVCANTLVPLAEQFSVQIYNQSDGLVVLSKGLEAYWRGLGVTVPIHVIPRTINTRVLDADVGPDPYPQWAKEGARILILCRLVREKNIARLLDIFAKHVAPHMPEASLTLVGDGADMHAFQDRAARLGVADRTFFPGEFPVHEVRSWYHHADLFMYGSLSETYGQVISEAMACGLPVVAFDDNAGVAQQIEHNVDGVLLPHGPDVPACNARFGAEVVSLLRGPTRRVRLAQAARASALARTDRQAYIDRYYTAFEQARRHRDLSKPDLSTLGRWKPIARWTALHAFVGSIAQVRPPSALNKHGRQQPAWTEAPAEAKRRSDGEAA
jgi:1,2-diacylglycerol 3-alpha-glucosyltransferase